MQQVIFRQLFICSCLLMVIVRSVTGGILGNGQIHPIQEKLIEKFNPQPLLDTIKEEEKYGNTQTHPIGRAFVAKVEVISKKLTDALNFPGQFKNRSKMVILEKLDSLGAKLVGLSDK